jgi:hypothetical protein
MPAPPTARAARWTKCQSPARPSSAEYWHIGDIIMRLGVCTDRRVSGRNRCGVGSRTSAGRIETTRPGPKGRVQVRNTNASPHDDGFLRSGQLQPVEGDFQCRAQAQNGNTIAAENYYQHAEHYFRSMFLRSNERLPARFATIPGLQSGHH